MSWITLLLGPVFVANAVVAVFVLLSCFFIGNHFLENLYVSLLTWIFRYANRNIAETSHFQDTVPLKQTSLIKRDVVLTDSTMRLNPDIFQDSNCSILELPAYFVKSGIEAILEDDVTQRFTSEELQTWNLLSRTYQYQHINVKLRIIWLVGFMVRYFIFFPVRICIFWFSFTLCVLNCFIIGMIPNAITRRYLNAYNLKFCFRLFTRAFTAIITFHNRENRARPDGICVANHTTPLDVIILGCDNSYAMVGQSHGGFLGIVEKAFSRCESHVWFNRQDISRRFVMSQLREHIEAENKLPILIFPEGTCINNTSVMMFKKGSFELGVVIYPVAIKYDPLFADCFWNSSRNSMLMHLFMMMTSWAIKADVWYLQPQRQRPDETAIEFASRVKRAIAAASGLVDLNWDGMLKREKPKDAHRLAVQQNFVKCLMQNSRA